MPKSEGYQMKLWLPIAKKFMGKMYSVWQHANQLPVDKQVV
jgi:hypothetical protein